MRRHLAFWLLLASALIVALLAVPRGQGPVFSGHQFSHWVEVIGRRQYVADFHVTDAEYQEAQAALAQAGTNAFPYLLKWIQFEYTGPGFKVLMALGRIVGDGPLKPLYTTLIQSSPPVRGRGAEECWTVCATHAPPHVIAELARLMNKTNAPQTACRATIILASAGPRAFPYLAPVFQDLNHPQHQIALFYVSQHKSFDASAQILIPGLLNSLAGDTTLLGGASAAKILAQLPTDPARLLPSLTNYLKDPQPRVRRQTTYVLMQLRPRCDAVVPILEHLLTDADPLVADGAARALTTIASAATTNAPPP